MTRQKIYSLLGVLVALSLFLIFYPAILHPNSYQEFASATSQRGHLVFLLYAGSPYMYNDTKALCKSPPGSPNVKSGDYIFIHGSANELTKVLNTVKNITNSCPSGVNVSATIQYVNVTALNKTVPTMKQGFNTIVYVYENGTAFTPEFTTNETKSIGYFGEAESAVDKYNTAARLLITPSYLHSPNWNWTSVAGHTDMIDIQYGSKTQAANLTAYVDKGITPFKKGNASEPAFAQITLIRPVGNPRAVANDTLNLWNSGIPLDGVLIYMQPDQTNDLQTFFYCLYNGTQYTKCTA